MEDDRERLERYVEWQKAADRKRAARRRRCLGSVAAVVAVGAVVGALAASRMEWPRSTPPAATAVAPPVAVEPSAPSPTPEAAPPATLERPAVVSRRAPPPRPRSHQRGRYRAPERAAPITDLPARATLEPSPPASPAPAEPAEIPELSAAVGPSVIPEATAPTVDPPPLPPVDAPASAAAPPEDSPLAEGSTAPTRARSRVANWVKGEMQEFRDGVTREIEEFRAGFEKVRGLFRRRDARSPARRVPRPTG